MGFKTFNNLIYIEILTIFWILTTICESTDDYAYYSQQERLRRAEPPGSRIEGLYSIQSYANDLFLTAKNGHAASLGPVLLKLWSDSASQLWDITKFDTARGYNLKPLANEFNYVTSELSNNAHSFNAWEFKKRPGMENTFIIYNALNRRCLQTATLGKPVEFEKCQPENVMQFWKLRRQD